MSVRLLSAERTLIPTHDQSRLFKDIGIQEAIALSTDAMGIRRGMGTAATYVKSRYLSEMATGNAGVGTLEVTDVSVYNPEQSFVWDKTALLDETKER